MLGPLVVSAAYFRVPAEQASLCLWKQLAGAIRKRPTKRGTCLAINDSKKLYHGLKGKDGLEHLERGVLAMLSTCQVRPKTLRELMTALGGRLDALAEYPWHAQDDLPLPHCAGATDVALMGNAVATWMKKVGIELLGIRSEVVFVSEYNRLVAAAKNKATVLFDVTCRLLAHLAGLATAEPMVVYLDRQGGRTHYVSPLQRVFEGWRLKVLEENEDLSAYVLRHEEKQIELRFRQRSDEDHLPTALASMACKYLREGFMVLFNRFWSAHVPDIDPTAGYYSDGNRFYEQIRPAMQALGLAEDIVYRSR